MEKRNIQIDLDTARKWYKDGGFYKDLALQAFNMNELEELELPKSWEEYENVLFSGVAQLNLDKYESNISILQKLLVLRDVYRQGWKPDWKNEDEGKWSVNRNFEVGQYYSQIHAFSFPTKELTKQFLKNFRKELEQLKELL